MRKYFIVAFFVLSRIAYANAQEIRKDTIKVELHRLLEIEVKNDKVYSDPLRDVELLLEFTNNEGKVFKHFGFYDGNQVWKIRFRPDMNGFWNYKYRFTDQTNETIGQFRCILTKNPEPVSKNQYNPFWLGKGKSSKTLFRSFHVGDRFFATNWDDPTNLNDGNKRATFLDWLQQNKYNMLSIGSLFTNRNEKDRGQGWETPKLWPLNPTEFRKMENILDELQKRDITVFPFAGFFGAKGEWPTEIKEQELYIKYMLARIGHYPNLILSVAGPEPFWREDVNQYKGAMRMNDLFRLGQTIKNLDVHNHILTVHNEKRATQYGDPFIDEPWCDMSTLQGPTTTNLEKLYSGLIMNHRRNKVCYAQETLWAGNLYHPDYTSEQLRKNLLTILFSGSILNFADMKGNSSTGFSGTLDLNDCNQQKHDVVKKTWDWFETIPFQQLIARQDLVKEGFCLANEGVEYYIYTDTISKIELFLNFPYMLELEWINAGNPSDVRKGKSVNQKTVFLSPGEGKDWILHVYAPKPSPITTGNFPDIAVDEQGNLHLVYNRSGLKYKKYDTTKKAWSVEFDLACPCNNVMRSDPDVVIDSKGNPHAYCGNEYVWFDGKKWNKVKPKGARDSELAINSKDELFLSSRGGNFKGHIGMETRLGKLNWRSLADPDENGKSVNNHVYTDLFIDNKNTIHLVQRHGPIKEVTYRQSTDRGLTWSIEEAVSDERDESPHIIADNAGNVLISTGKGTVYERDSNGKWNLIGRKVSAMSRTQPELGIDKSNNIYLTAFGGNYNTHFNGNWLNERMFDKITESQTVGFVETAGVTDFAYIVWEEGHGNADEGLGDDSNIIVGILYPDGRIIRL